ncbi:XRE family transcriptional regulator [Cohnella abietis]|uniref:Transcriptional regulator n=1 Tax=Cohnella abietis TaxID=2507935 RepID=A0A3T1D2M4_9BACL|nr:XRE family transcriptional regulator [Cohnella abietis]BBI32334.1 transcriptional regulator [Cohnella abietis]
MYPNLTAELARRGLKQKDIIPVLKTNRPATVSEKLNGKAPLLLDEAFLIQAAFFPDLSLGYLFDKDVKNVH